MARSYHGTGEQAIAWAVDHVGFEADTFLRAWQQGDAEKEWPDFYKWLDAQPKLPKVGDGTPDAALAIGEHAFRAGYNKGWDDHRNSPDWRAPDSAWDAYDPPEHIKDLT